MPRAWAAELLVLCVLAAPASLRAEGVNIRLDMPPETREDWARCLESYEPGYVRLNPGTQASCAAVAMRLTQDAIHETGLGPGVLDELGIAAEVDGEALRLLAFARPGDALALATAYLTASTAEEYAGILRGWAASEVLSGAAGALPAGYGEDGTLTPEATEAARALYFSLVRRVSDAELGRAYHHPACGEVEVRFKLIAGRQLGSRRAPFLRFASRAVCLDADPAAAAPVPHAFGVVADFPASVEADGAPERAVLRLAAPGHSMVTAACEPSGSRAGLRAAGGRDEMSASLGDAPALSTVPGVPAGGGPGARRGSPQ